MGQIQNIRGREQRGPVVAPKTLPTGKNELLTSTSGPETAASLAPDQVQTQVLSGLGAKQSVTFPQGLSPTPLKLSEMLWFQGQVATWGASGSHLPGKESFADWVKQSPPNGAETPLPPFNSTLLMNCAEFVFYTALRSDKIDRSWLQNWSQKVKVTEPYEQFMLPHGAQSMDYRVQDGKVQMQAGPRPKEGDVLIFDGASHVMLATGREVDGKTEVISFSPLPLWGEGSFTMGKADVAPEVTTVEDLIQNLVDLYPDSPVDWAKIQIRFGAAPWVSSLSNGQP